MNYFRELCPGQLHGEPRLRFSRFRAGEKSGFAEKIPPAFRDYFSSVQELKLN